MDPVGILTKSVPTYPKGHTVFDFRGYPASSDSQRAIPAELFVGAVEQALDAFYAELSAKLSHELIGGDIGPDAVARFESAAQDAAWQWIYGARVTREFAAELGWDPDNHG